jgi:DNA-binding LytR/AlgR family response regulator
MLRVLAVDDEKPALEELLYLLRSDPRVHSAEGATDATEALRRIGRALEAGPDGPDAVDVVFLDIHMAGLTGLDVARLLAGFARPPLVVFVTAHEGFAVQAFDLKAVDYVLKPVRKERLAEAVRRVSDLSEPAPAGTVPEQVPVELGGVTRFVAVDDIAYVEAQGDYARLHTDGGSHLVRIPLSTLEERGRGAGCGSGDIGVRGRGGCGPGASSASTAATWSPSAGSTSCASTAEPPPYGWAAPSCRSAAVTPASCATSSPGTSAADRGGPPAG